ncbi:hypothetical protein E2C01_070400 [Portunus trituberculatus]|uniref:Uncharacterized protein n=1 Tax=Portunus trituberculatus TaxID=210409 RepID=A0A5B7I260_PORTR|nr:hypothetical protein [Portunus trituberculatus]
MTEYKIINGKTSRTEITEVKIYPTLSPAEENNDCRNEPTMYVHPLTNETANRDPTPAAASRCVGVA